MTDTEKPPGPLKGDDAAEGSVDPIIGDAVGSRLKSLFNGFVEETVPDQFMVLIAELEANERAAKAAADGNDGDDDEPGSDKAGT